MIGLSICLVFMIIFQTNALTNFSCNDVQSHKNINLLTSPADCLPMQTFSDRILGGNHAEIWEFPWMAILFDNSPGSEPRKFCDGSIISGKYILTAAHCLTNKKLELNLYNLTIRVGEYDLNKTDDCDEYKCSYATDYEAESYLFHPKYDANEDIHDIGLIRLKEEIVFNEFVYPVCLPTSCSLMNENVVGKYATLAGWGHLMDEPKVVTTHILQKVTMPVVEQSMCNEQYKRVLLESHLCVGGGEGRKLMKDACSGDSGGPLIYPRPLDETLRDGQEYYVQIGLVSSGLNCNPNRTEETFGMYTKVASYMDWILDNMSGL